MIWIDTKNCYMKRMYSIKIMTNKVDIQEQTDQRNGPTFWLQYGKNSLNMAQFKMIILMVKMRILTDMIQLLKRRRKVMELRCIFERMGDVLLLTKQLMEPSNSYQDQSQQVFTEMVSIYVMVEISIIIERVFTLVKTVCSVKYQFLDGSYNSGAHIS